MVALPQFAFSALDFAISAVLQGNPVRAKV
jgi:hypothetical protein